VTLDPNVTPEFEEVIRMAIEQRLFDLNTALPGIVQDYDPATRTASIQPALQRKYQDSVVSLAVVLKVPVIFPSAGSWQISGPIKPNDSGLLLFSQRSLDVWKKQGGLVDPRNPRKFHITDAVFVPGLVPQSRVNPNSTENLRIENGKAVLELTPDGRIEFKQSGGKSLVDTLISITGQLSALADILSKTTTNTMIGPQPLLDASNIAQIKSKIDGFKTDLTGLKES
jgi:hypothetical protein